MDRTRSRRSACPRASATCRWSISGVLIVLVFDRAHHRAPARRGGRPVMALTILCVTFFGFLVLGVPVAFAIGLSAICTILYEGLPVAVIFQQMMSGMNIFSFLAIPFFIFSRRADAARRHRRQDRAASPRASSATSAAASACRTWWPARCSAASRARRWPTSRRWAR